MDPLLERMAAHRSVRAYQPVPVPREHVLTAVRVAQTTATSSNRQAYALLQVTDAAELATLAELCGDQAQVRDAGAFFVVCGEQRRHRAMAEAHESPFAPNLESFLVDVIDATLFAQTLALAFEAQGYGTCFIGALRNRLAEVDALLALPADTFPLFGLCVGVPAEDPGPKPRLAPEAVLAEGRLPDDAAVEAHVAEYDARMAAYYAARGLPGRDWSGGLWRKFAKPAREHLYDYFTSKGAYLR